MRLRIGSDDEDKNNAEIETAMLKGNKLELFKGLIRAGKAVKGEKLVLTVKLHNAKRCPLEVTAYVK